MQYKKILSCCFDFTSMSPFQLWTVSLYCYLVLWAMIRIWGNILFPYSVIASTNSKSKQIWIYVDCLVTPIDWEWYIEAYIWVSLYTYYMILMSFPARDTKCSFCHVFNSLPAQNYGGAHHKSAAGWLELSLMRWMCWREWWYNGIISHNEQIRLILVGKGKEEKS